MPRHKRKTPVVTLYTYVAPSAKGYLKQVAKRYGRDLSYWTNEMIQAARHGRQFKPTNARKAA